jgi:iron complex transport system substrate-binding protein
MPRRRILALAAAPLALLALASCGDDDGGGDTDAASGTTSSGTAAEDAPQRIVSLAPTPTEMLFAIGAGDQVVAVDDQSNHPEGAPQTGLSGFEPNVEAIVDYEPDLVVLTDDVGDVVAGLEAADVEALLLPAATTLDDTYEQLEQLGEATGHEDEAADVVEGMQADIEEITSSLPEREDPAPTYYHELDQALFTATSETFIGQVYDLVGLDNVADAADTDGSGYPQLSAEYLLQQDPDLIFLADTKCCGQTAETVAARPGWGELQAVQEGRVVELDDDIASRWGPRVVDLLRTVADEVAGVPAG